MKVIIAGASSGIGAALTTALAEDGHELFVCGRRADRLARLSDGCERIKSRSCDVSRPNDVEVFATWIRQHTDSIDVLVNCAGGFGAIGRMWETDAKEWTQTIATNLFGTYYMIRAIVPLLKGGSRPRIINMSGGGAFNPFPHYSAYAVSKAAVVRLTETLAEELAPLGVMVNGIAPGFVATEIHDATLKAGARAGNEHLDKTKELLADGKSKVRIDVPVRCVKFLVSPSADGLTGKTISAGFDPWDDKAFEDCIDALNESELYTQRRVNLVHLADSKLKGTLEQASARRSDENG